MLAVVEFDDPKTDEVVTGQAAVVLKELARIIDGRADPLRSSVEEAVAEAGILGQETQDRVKAILEPTLEPRSKVDASAAARRAREVVETKLHKGDQARSFGLWKAATDSTAPGVPILVVYRGDPGKRLSDYQCSRCTVVTEEAIDPDIFRIFSGSVEPGIGDPRILVADAAGRRTFEAPLSETTQRETFAARLKAAASAHE